MKAIPNLAPRAGLSGSGRPRHPRVKLKLATAADIRSGGAGWTMTAGFGPSPYGECLAAQTPQGVCHLSFVDGSRKAAWGRLTDLWPNAHRLRDDAAAKKILAGVFAPPGRQKSRRPLTLLVKGTDFQLRVWRALLRIPSGARTTYGRLAASIGAPQAARAVGSAVGSNELAWLIPCHRVIRQSGATGGYRWGVPRKQAMLACEASE